MNDMTDKTHNGEIDTGNTELALGAGVTAYGIGLAALSGIVCPTCVIAAPALLGYGAYKRHKAKSKTKASPNKAPLQDTDSSAT